MEFHCEANSSFREDVDYTVPLASEFVAEDVPGLKTHPHFTPQEVNTAVTSRDLDLSTESSKFILEPVTSVHTSAVKLPLMHPSNVTDAHILLDFPEAPLNTPRANKLLSAATKNKAVLDKLTTQRAEYELAVESAVAEWARETAEVTVAFTQKKGDVDGQASKCLDQASILTREADRLISFDTSPKSQAKIAAQKRKLLMKAQKIQSTAQYYLNEHAKLEAKENAALMRVDGKHTKVLQALHQSERKRLKQNMKYQRNVADCLLKLRVLEARQL